MFGTHRAYVSSSGSGYGRYSYTWTCSCGRKGGGYGSHQDAQKSARKHEGRR